MGLAVASLRRPWVVPCSAGAILKSFTGFDPMSLKLRFLMMAQMGYKFWVMVGTWKAQGEGKELTFAEHVCETGMYSCNLCEMSARRTLLQGSCINLHPWEDVNWGPWALRPPPVCSVVKVINTGFS